MRKLEANVWHNAGVTYVVEYWTKKLICYSIHFRRATRKARNLGYDVTVYKDMYAKAPKDAVRVSLHGYVLPRKPRT